MRIEAFTRYNEMTGDAYVMDYTQATAGKRKVCIKEEDPDDIASFHLINPRKTTYWAVNFEENPAVLKGSDQCECMFVSSRASSKGWVCLVELKYCLEKNIERNAGDAFKQLYETLNKLVELNIVDYKSHRIYLNTKVSHPLKHQLFSFSFVCLPPYPLTVNTCLTEVMQTIHILRPIFPTLQPLQGFCSSLCRFR